MTTKRVPIEMTPAMRLAFWEANEAYEDGNGEAPDCHWAALLKAAPFTLERRVFDADDPHIRTALIALGWTPPQPPETP